MKSATADVLLVAALLGSGGARAAQGGELRALPAACAGLDQARIDQAERAPGADHEREWQRLYTLAYEEIERREPDLALRHDCAALAHARGFAARDWRFAETLDDYGYIQFMRGDMDASVSAQSAAVAEMLLAMGPGDARVATYAARLTSPLAAKGAEALAKQIVEAPYRVFGSSLVVLDRGTAKRLDWLIAEYLAREDLTAAHELQALQERADPRERVDPGVGARTPAQQAVEP